MKNSPIDNPNKNAKKKYILLVEDEVAYAHLLQDKLEEAGFRVVLVRSGDLALEEIKRKKPDLVILDLILPIKDGYELLEDLYKEEAIKGLKILILSNLGKEVKRKKTNKPAVVDYIVKTDISLEEMIKKVKEHCP